MRPGGLTPDQSSALVGTRVLVTAFGGSDGSPYATGRVIGYSIAPELVLEVGDGSRVHWRHDLCRVATLDETVSPVGRLYSRERVRELEAALETADAKLTAAREIIANADYYAELKVDLVEKVLG